MLARFVPKYIPEPNSGCWLWVAMLGSGGYGRFKVGNKNVYAHRLSYEHHVGAIPEGLDLDHLCRTRCCVNPTHLEPVTRKENIRRGLGNCAQVHPELLSRGENHYSKKHPEKVAQGDTHYSRTRPELMSRGEGHYQSKLNNELVLEIRQRVAKGERQSEVSLSLGLTKQLVNDVIKRKTWKHI